MTKSAELSVPALMRKYGLSARKSLGQNFLLDEAALEKVVAAAEIPAQATVLEIGPGLGSLTRHLARAADRVVAVELDQNLIPALQEVLSAEKNVTILHGDILEQNIPALVSDPGYLVVANIPYYITSAVIRHLLEAPVRPSRLVLTMQKEVADRICAKPGDLSLLALSVQVYGEPRPVARIPAGAFYPPPNVDSMVLRVDLYPEPRIPNDQLNDFFRLAKMGFAQKRKTLRNTLSAGLHWAPEKAAQMLAAAEIDPMRRAETLSLAEWARLVCVYRETAK
ncbi:dimethyladenosine transferase [Longilinea arvoryzae]|uniref:Ribosomal RNA small subunit methyltransferase A n=1 Tax=Longilinea arvoryzae TaxID=360412 RepID=A0A0S7BMV2_9CHLR|nr:16S rRNA (adenine(1518)-N(6)/adenine(1519)-N(6))-dimethyltransferase RsmA [Longilinea arvoryzae]GAP15586.1 dimethyladenosine transferase [Longilinea arvoryzae]